MTRLEIQIKIRALRDELENRHKYGTVKLADNNGNPIPTIDIQNKLYALVYKLSKFD
jgi:hypothetical protein